MFDFLKFHYEPQKTTKKNIKKQFEKQKRVGQIHLDIQKEWFEIQTQSE